MKNIFSGIIGTALIGSLVLIGCENNYPDSIWPLEEPATPIPTVTRIDPPDSSLSGVGELTIVGENFISREPYNVNNLVYFDKVKANVISATDTTLVVTTPNLVKDSIYVKVGSRTSVDYSDLYLYKLNAAVEVVGKLDEKKDQASSITTDPTGNAYVMVKEQFDNVIKTIDPAGRVQRYKEKLTFFNYYGMKYGPDNKLYAGIASGRTRVVYSISNTSEESYVTLSVIPTDLDFDQDKNIWLVGRQKALTINPSNIVRIKPDRTQQVMATYDVLLETVRIYIDNGTPYIYVAGYDTTFVSGDAMITIQKIWRNQILPDGNLDTSEVVLDAVTCGWLDKVIIQVLTFSENGKIYLGTNAEPDPIFIYDPQSGDHEVLYPGLIKPSIIDFTWDNNNMGTAGAPYYRIFAIQQLTTTSLQISSQVLKIGVSMPGAPYYGMEP